MIQNSSILIEGLIFLGKLVKRLPWAQEVVRPSTLSGFNWTQQLPVPATEYCLEYPQWTQSGRHWAVPRWGV